MSVKLNMDSTYSGLTSTEMWHISADQVHREKTCLKMHERWAIIYDGCMIVRCMCETVLNSSFNHQTFRFHQASPELSLLCMWNYTVQ